MDNQTYYHLSVKSLRATQLSKQTGILGRLVKRCIHFEVRTPIVGDGTHYEITVLYHEMPVSWLGVLADVHRYMLPVSCESERILFLGALLMESAE